jgi:hypothetical protein
MTLQSLLPSLLAPASEERRHQSWWHTLVASFAADRRKADEHVTEPRPSHQNSEQRDLFRVEFERRLLGQ